MDELNAPSADKPEEFVGSRLGKFEVIQYIGRGGFGTVYLARHRKLETKRVLKILHDTSTTIIAEARKQAAVQHPNIVRIDDVEDDTIPNYIVMEHMPDGDLTRLITQTTPEDAITIMQQVMQALSHIHANNYTHLDLKPQNILLNGKIAKISDFGLAKTFGDYSERFRTTHSTIGGTPEYIPPEQGSGIIAPTNDIYSAGITFYQLLTGKLPQQTGFNDIRALNEQVPEKLDALIMKAISQSPRKRQQSAQEVLEELNGIIEHSDIDFSEALLAEPETIAADANGIPTLDKSQLGLTDRLKPANVKNNPASIDESKDEDDINPFYGGNFTEIEPIELDNTPTDKKVPLILPTQQQTAPLDQFTPDEPFGAVNPDTQYDTGITYDENPKSTKQTQSQTTPAIIISTQTTKLGGITVYTHDANTVRRMLATAGRKNLNGIGITDAYYAPELETKPLIVVKDDRIVRLSLCGIPITSVAEVTELTELLELNINGTKVTDISPLMITKIAILNADTQLESLIPTILMQKLQRLKTTYDPNDDPVFKYLTKTHETFKQIGHLTKTSQTKRPTYQAQAEKMNDWPYLRIAGTQPQYRGTQDPENPQTTTFELTITARQGNKIAGTIQHAHEMPTLTEMSHSTYKTHFAGTLDSEKIEFTEIQNFRWHLFKKIKFTATKKDRWIGTYEGLGSGQFEMQEIR